MTSTQAGAAANGSYDDVWACGPEPENGDGPADPPFEDSAYGFQCTELANRFLWVVWEKMPINSGAAGAPLTGWNYVKSVAAKYKPLAADVVTDGTQGKPYLPGDIVSFSGTGDETDGHVAVVIQSSYTPSDVNGDYSVTIEQQNASGPATQLLQVSDWALAKPTPDITPDDFLALPPKLGWTAEPAPGPTVQDVSCPTSSGCMAVGDDIGPSGDDETVAQTWNGAAWTLLAAQPDASPGSALYGVYCASLTDCVAVGVDDSANGTLAETWDGAAWTPSSVPLPAGAVSGGQLTGVSCVPGSGTDFCIAVGTWEDDDGYDHPLAEQWNGSTWTLLTTPDPGITKHSGTENASFNSVSCSTNTSCEAVGTYGSNPIPGFGEAWNGTNWSEQAMPKPRGLFQTFLNGVSCSGPSSCTAVGGWYTADYGSRSGLIERLAGTKWSAEKSPSVPEPWDSVSCASSTSCVAVEGTGNGEAGFWSGKSWTTGPMPNSYDYSVSCVSPTWCMAAGSASAIYSNLNAPTS